MLFPRFSLVIVLALAVASCADAAPPASSSTTVAVSTAPSTAPSTTGPTVTSTGPTTTTTTTPTTTTAAPTTTTTTLPADVCAAFSGVEAVGTVGGGPEEISGVVVGRRDPAVLWVHEDSGSPGRIFALDRTGGVIAEVTIAGARPRDWEDIAIGPGPEPDVAYLFLGDIGDNTLVRDRIAVHRLPEPEITGASFTVRDVATFELVYPDGPHDAEVLLVDPGSGHLLVVAKNLLGSAAVYRADLPAVPAGPVALERAGTIPLGLLRPATGGDVTAAGDLVAIRTYTDVFLWSVPDGESVAAVLGRRPCSAPAPDEQQGEAIALEPDGTGYLTIGEGAASPVYHSVGP